MGGLAAIFFSALGTGAGFLILYLPLALILWLCGVSKINNDRVGKAIFALGFCVGVFKYSTEMTVSASMLPSRPANIRRAQQSLEQGEHDVAIRFSSRAIKAEDSAEVREIRALAYLESGDIEKALKDVRFGLIDDPKREGLYRVNAQIHEKTGDFNAEIGCYQSLLKVASDPQSVRYSIAKKYEDHKEYARAIGEYSAIVTSTPKFEDSRRRLAWLLATVPTDNYRDGKRARKLVIEEFRNTPDWKEDYKLAVILAAVLAENGDFKGAMKAMKRAMTIEPRRNIACEKVMERFQNQKPWRL